MAALAALSGIAEGLFNGIEVAILPLLLAAVLVWSAAVGLIIYFTNP